MSAKCSPPSMSRYIKSSFSYSKVSPRIIIESPPYVLSKATLPVPRLLFAGWLNVHHLFSFPSAALNLMILLDSQFCARQKKFTGSGSNVTTLSKMSKRAVSGTYPPLRLPV